MSEPEIMRNAGQVVSLNIRKAIQHVEKTHGLSQWQQLREMRRMARGPGRIPPVEFYNLGLYRTTLTPAERLQFVAIESGAALNARLNPSALQSPAKLMTDKLAFALLTAGAGHLAPVTLALLDDRIGNPGTTGPVRVLHDAASVEAFLQDCPLPLFGKPRYSSRATGVFNLFSRSADGRTGIMGNGREFSLAALAAEVVSHYSEGYLFQVAVREREELAAYSGIALGTCRVNTLLGPDGAEVLYTCWRVPGREALADNFFYKGSAHCHVDPATCTVIRAQSGNMTFGGEVTVHEPTGLPLKGYHIPGLAEGQKVACDLHNLFPEHGTIGFDIALTTDGPVVIEANHNPIHGTYQITADRGLLNAEFKPRIDACIAVQQQRVSALDAAVRANRSSRLRRVLAGMGLARPKK